MDKATIIAILIGVTIGVFVFLSSRPHVCEVPEPKTITFLEGELSKAFEESDQQRHKKNWYINALKKCQSVTDKELCEDRNLWMKRAHQGRNLRIPPEVEIDCSVF